LDISFLSSPDFGSPLSVREHRELAETKGLSYLDRQQIAAKPSSPKPFKRA
jgi:hypothetical protein